MEAKCFDTCIDILKSIQQSCKILELLLVCHSDLSLRPSLFIIYCTIIVHVLFYYYLIFYRLMAKKKNRKLKIYLLQLKT